MTLKLQGSSSGHTALEAPASAGSNTLVLPPNNGSAGQILQTDGNGNLTFIHPAGYGHFRAYLVGDQTVTNNSEEVVEFANVEGNGGNAAGWFNTSNYRYTPTIAGWHQFHFHAFWNGNTDNKAVKFRARLWKNGSTIMADNYAGIDDMYGALSNSVDSIIYLNGSGDYIDFRAYGHSADGTNPQLEGDASSQYTYAYGYLLEAA